MAAGVKNPPARIGDAEDLGLIPNQKGPLEKEMATHSSILAWKEVFLLPDRGAWWATVHGVLKSQTWLSTCTDLCIIILPILWMRKHKKSFKVQRG